MASTSNRVISTPVLRLQSPTVLVSEPEARRPSDDAANPCCPDVGCRWNYFNRHIILWYKFPTSLARAACVWPENMLYPGGGYRRIPLYSRGGHSFSIRRCAGLHCVILKSLASLIGNATRRAFVRIVDLCLDEQVDALLLAGDLYDGDQTSMKTARFLVEQLRRLSEAGIKTFIIRGNHDAFSRITRELVFPDTVKVFGGRAEVVTVERGGSDYPVVIHGLSFTHPQSPESLIGKYKAPVPDAVNIGLMHTSMTGAPGHNVYAPCSLADLQRTEFQYWAAWSCPQAHGCGWTMHGCHAGHTSRT